jgi:hypothetical protein
VRKIDGYEIAEKLISLAEKVISFATAYLIYKATRK